jgi:hypothetical protein
MRSSGKIWSNISMYAAEYFNHASPVTTWIERNFPKLSEREYGVAGKEDGGSDSSSEIGAGVERSSKWRLNYICP